MKKKSVLIFIPSIDDGGVEKNLFIISNYLAKKKISVKVLTSFNDKKEKFNKEIEIISLKNKNFIFKSRLVKTLVAILLFIKYFYNKEILIFSFQSNITAIILGLIFNKKVIIRSNTTPEKYLKNSIKKEIIKFFFNFADEIIVNSIEFKKHFKKIFFISPLVIYNPFVGKKAKKIKFNFFNDQKILKIINVSRLTDQKDHLTLIKAVEKLSKIYNCRLLIIGKGYKEKFLKSYIFDNKLEKYIKLIGYKKNPESYIKLSDVFVLSSVYEGLPNVLLEALHLKKLIISSDCPTGPKEILKNGKYGYLFKVRDHNELCRLLKNYNHKKNQNKYKINQGYKSLSRFSYNINCKKYFQLLSKYL